MPFFLQKAAYRAEVISSGDSLVVHPVLLEAPQGDAEAVRRSEVELARARRSDAGRLHVVQEKTHTFVTVALLEVVDPARQDMAGSEGGLCCGTQRKRCRPTAS